MTRATVFALALVLAALAAVVVVVRGMATRDRAVLVERFSADELQQTDEVAKEIGEDLEDVSEDLRFAGQLVSAASSASERERELGALLAVVKQYREVQVFDSAGARVLSVLDPLAPIATPSFNAQLYEAAVADTARHALGRPAGEVATSGRIGA